MSDETKKYLGIGIAIISLLVAGMVFYNIVGKNGSSSMSGNPDVALFCTHCGGFEITLDEFRELMKNQSNPMMAMPGQSAAITCPKCSKKSCYQAQRCQQCEAIFFFF